LLGEVGMEPERIQMFNMSAAMAGEFVKRAEEIVTSISTMGHTPLRDTAKSSNEKKMESAG
jgi:coenzyme F420-reducing hydrogenase delta subunit